MIHVRRRSLLLLLLTAGLLAGCFLARGKLLPSLASWLDVGGPPQTADDIVLLTGDADTRAFVAASLYKAGWAPRVLLSTVAAGYSQERRSILAEHEINRQVLLKCGVPERDVTVLNGRAKSTFDEARALADYLDGSPWRRIIVVTNDFHTRRARWIFQRVLGGRAGQIVVVSAASDEFQPGAWWQSEIGFATVGGEYLKLAFYHLRYGYLAWELAAVGLLLAILMYRRRRAGACPGRIHSARNA
jgi:uncharacterized SAM-binding protein YcdF (DUF218 family)